MSNEEENSHPDSVSLQIAASVLADIQDNTDTTSTDANSQGYEFDCNEEEEVFVVKSNKKGSRQRKRDDRYKPGERPSQKLRQACKKFDDEADICRIWDQKLKGVSWFNVKGTGLVTWIFIPLSLKSIPVSILRKYGRDGEDYCVDWSGLRLMIEKKGIKETTRWAPAPSPKLLQEKLSFERKAAASKKKKQRSVLLKQEKGLRLEDSVKTYRTLCDKGTMSERLKILAIHECITKESTLRQVHFFQLAEKVCLKQELKLLHDYFSELLVNEITDQPSNQVSPS